MIGKITAISCHLESLDHWMNWVALAKNLQVRPLSNRFILVIDFHHARRLVDTKIDQIGKLTLFGTQEHQVRLKRVSELQEVVTA